MPQWFHFQPFENKTHPSLELINVLWFVHVIANVTQKGEQTRIPYHGAKKAKAKRSFSALGGRVYFFVHKKGEIRASSTRKTTLKMCAEKCPGTPGEPGEMHPYRSAQTLPGAGSWDFKQGDKTRDSNPSLGHREPQNIDHEPCRENICLSSSSK